MKIDDTVLLLVVMFQIAHIAVGIRTGNKALVIFSATLFLCVVGGILWRKLS